MHPNPARDMVLLRLPDDESKEIALYAPTGQRLAYWPTVNGSEHQISLGQLTPGAYCVRVSNSISTRAKVLIVH